MSYRTISKSRGTAPWCRFRVWCLLVGEGSGISAITARHLFPRHLGNCRKNWGQGTGSHQRTHGFGGRGFRRLASPRGASAALRRLERIGDLRGGHGGSLEGASESELLMLWKRRQEIVKKKFAHDSNMVPWRRRRSSELFTAGTYRRAPVAASASISTAHLRTRFDRLESWLLEPMMPLPSWKRRGPTQILV